VDDDESVRSSFPLALATVGVDVEVASGPEGAKRLVDEREFDLVVTDLDFAPESGRWEGLALLRSLRRSHPVLPVVVMSAFSTAAVESEALALGARDFWAKSLPIPAILERLRKLEGELRPVPARLGG
jgi:DNA-binding NtrC family response regulator